VGAMYSTRMCQVLECQDAREFRWLNLYFFFFLFFQGRDHHLESFTVKLSLSNYIPATRCLPAKFPAINESNSAAIRLNLSTEVYVQTGNRSKNEGCNNGRRDEGVCSTFVYRTLGRRAVEYYHKARRIKEEEILIWRYDILQRTGFPQSFKDVTILAEKILHWCGSSEVKRPDSGFGAETRKR